MEKSDSRCSSCPRAYSKTARRNEHVTLTHFITKVLALTLKEPIDLNGYISFGRFVPHKTVDLSVAVALEGGKNLAMVKLNKVDELSVTSIAQTLNEKLMSYEQGKIKI